MNWTESISQWRRLPAGEKLRHRWQAIPQDVAQSMAFEREPVPVETSVVRPPRMARIASS